MDILLAKFSAGRESFIKSLFLLEYLHFDHIKFKG
jgi:hypothetical protein